MTTIKNYPAKMSIALNLRNPTLETVYVYNGHMWLAVTILNNTNIKAFPSLLSILLDSSGLEDFQDPF